MLIYQHFVLKAVIRTTRLFRRTRGTRAAKFASPSVLRRWAQRQQGTTENRH